MQGFCDIFLIQLKNKNEYQKNIAKPVGLDLAVRWAGGLTLPKRW